MRSEYDHQYEAEREQLEYLAHQERGRARTYSRDSSFDESARIAPELGAEYGYDEYDEDDAMPAYESGGGGSRAGTPRTSPQGAYSGSGGGAAQDPPSPAAKAYYMAADAQEAEMRAAAMAEIAEDMRARADLAQAEAEYEDATVEYQQARDDFMSGEAAPATSGPLGIAAFKLVGGDPSGRSPAALEFPLTGEPGDEDAGEDAGVGGTLRVVAPRAAQLRWLAETSLGSLSPSDIGNIVSAAAPESGVLDFAGFNEVVSTLMELSSQAGGDFDDDQSEQSQVQTISVARSLLTPLFDALDIASGARGVVPAPDVAASLTLLSNASKSAKLHAGWHIFGAGATTAIAADGTPALSKIREEYPDRVMSTGCRVEVGLGCLRKAG